MVRRMRTADSSRESVAHRLVVFVYVVYGTSKMHPYLFIAQLDSGGMGPWPRPVLTSLSGSKTWRIFPLGAIKSIIE